MTSADLGHAGTNEPSRTVAPAVTPPAEPGVAVVESADLFKGATELRVRHRGDEYRLRITRQGKLILTK